MVTEDVSWWSRLEERDGGIVSMSDCIADTTMDPTMHAHWLGARRCLVLINTPNSDTGTTGLSPADDWAGVI